jgi:Fe-S-cluster containining protein
MGSICCEHCTAICCRYLALPIEEPTTARDFDDIRWYLMHRGVTVFVEDGEWYVQVSTVCQNLRPDNLCSIYETRPKICREYKAGECDYVGGHYEYDHLFHCPEELAEYVKQRSAANGRRAKSKKRKSAGTKKRRRARM